MSPNVVRALLLGGVLTVSAQAERTCASLRDLELDHASVASAEMKAAAEFQPPAGPAVPVPEHCEVKVVARPTSDSEINIEIWLPPPGKWNGKYLQRGNGGWAGAIPVRSLIAPLTRGYVTAGTDDGHKGGDATFALGHPEKLIDFGHRALHETAIHAKAVAKALYGKGPAPSYFSGCSDGGREALQEAQRYPDDFDGIIAGAPANYWTHHFTGFIWNEKALKEKPESKIPADKLPAIQKAAIAACDMIDGVKDGLIEDPRKCNFDPAALKCEGADGMHCLTPPQIAALKKVYEGPRSPATGEQIYPGYEPGTEADPTTWAPWILGPIQERFGNGLYAYAVFERPDWDWRTIDFDRDLKLANEKVGHILNSYSPDLRSFRARGGKLIQYHGWGDAAIAPRDSIHYYEKVQAFLKAHPDPRSGNAGKPVQDFYRLFMVPGLSHCAGGIGANTFGNTDSLDPAVQPQDADHDILLALDRWVTQSVAPDKIIATGKTGTNGTPAAERLKMTRPLCPYPQAVRYKGSGDINDAANFTCEP